MPRVPDDLKYTPEHEWVRLEGSRATIGISDYAQSQLGDIVYVEPPPVGAQVAFLKACGSIESVKAASDLFAPLSGTVVAVNAALNDAPEVINRDCYGAGWLFQIEMRDPRETARLLDAAAYRRLLESKK